MAAAVLEGSHMSVGYGRRQQGGSNGGSSELVRRGCGADRPGQAMLRACGACALRVDLLGHGGRRTESPLAATTGAEQQECCSIKAKPLRRGKERVQGY